MNRLHHVRDVEVMAVSIVSDAACETDVLSTCSVLVLAVPKVREACAMAGSLYSMIETACEAILQVGGSSDDGLFPVDMSNLLVAAKTDTIHGKNLPKVLSFSFVAILSKSATEFSQLRHVQQAQWFPLLWVRYVYASTMSVASETCL